MKRLHRIFAAALVLAAGCGGTARGVDPDALRDAKAADAEHGVPWEKGQKNRARSSPAPRGGPLDAEYEGHRPIEVRKGRASYYADSLAGNRTASGDVYEPQAFTAATRDLPFGTIVRVVRVDDGRSVVVRINDRGPFGRRKRIIDLSRAAAEKIGMIRAGVVEVRAEILELGR